MGWRGVGKASLKLQNCHFGAVKQEGLDGESVWARGVAGGGKGLIESEFSGLGANRQ